MTHCRVDQRAAAMRVKRDLQADPRVLDVTIVSPGEDPTNQFLLDVALGESAGGFPTDLCDDLDAGPTVRNVQPQGGFWTAFLVL